MSHLKGKVLAYCTVTGCWMLPAEGLAHKTFDVDGKPFYTHITFG